MKYVSQVTYKFITINVEKIMIVTEKNDNLDPGFWIGLAMILVFLYLITHCSR